MRECVELPAIKDNELRLILDKFNLSKKIDSGEVICVSCEKVIQWENIGALLVDNGGLVIYCDSPECIEEVSKEQR